MLDESSKAFNVIMHELGIRDSNVYLSGKKFCDLSRTVAGATGNIESDVLGNLEFVIFI